MAIAGQLYFAAGTLPHAVRCYSVALSGYGSKQWTIVEVRLPLAGWFAWITATPRARAISPRPPPPSAWVVLFPPVMLCSPPPDVCVLARAYVFVCLCTSVCGVCDCVCAHVCMCLWQDHIYYSLSRLLSTLGDAGTAAGFLSRLLSTGGSRLSPE